RDWSSDVCSSDLASLGVCTLDPGCVKSALPVNQVYKGPFGQSKHLDAMPAFLLVERIGLRFSDVRRIKQGSHVNYWSSSSPFRVSGSFSSRRIRTDSTFLFTLVRIVKL